MKVHLIAYGIARDILGAQSGEIDIEPGSTIAVLKMILTDRYVEFQKLSSLSFAVNEQYVPDEYLLQNHDEVVILPPVSGG